MQAYVETPEMAERGLFLRGLRLVVSYVKTHPGPFLIAVGRFDGVRARVDRPDRRVGPRRGQRPATRVQRRRGVVEDLARDRRDHGRRHAARGRDHGSPVLQRRRGRARDGDAPHADRRPLPGPLAPVPQGDADRRADRAHGGRRRGGGRRPAPDPVRHRRALPGAVRDDLVVRDRHLPRDDRRPAVPDPRGHEPELRAPHGGPGPPRAGTDRRRVLRRPREHRRRDDREDARSRSRGDRASRGEGARASARARPGRLHPGGVRTRARGAAGRRRGRAHGGGVVAGLGRAP